MKTWNEELIRTVIGCAVQNVMLDMLDVARKKLDNTVKYLINNGHVSDGQSSITDNGNDIYIVEFQFKNYNNAIVTYIYEISPNKIEEVKPFDFSLLERPIAQIISMLDGFLTHNKIRKYTTLEVLHSDISDIDFIFKKLKIAAKYEK